MKRLVFASVIASGIAVSGCATDPYGYNNNPQAQRAVQGAALGGLVGAAIGGVAGAVIKGKQYYRDTRGYCYYVDQYGNPIYDYNVRC